MSEQPTQDPEPATRPAPEPLDPSEQPVAGGADDGEPAQGAGEPDSY